MPGHSLLPTLLILLLVTSTCITPVNLDPPEPDRILVVDGFINDQQGPFEITITRMQRFAGTLEGGAEIFENDAEVYILDQNGVRTDFLQPELTRTDITNPCAASGGCCALIVDVPVTSVSYRTPDSFKGEIGNTYTLNIVTFNGREYRSTPQTILPGPPIDSVSYRYKRLPSVDPVTFNSGVEVFVSWSDPAETRNFQAWRVNGIYKIETPPKNGNCCLYAPGNGVVCWINEKNVSGIGSHYSDDRSNGGAITQRVGFIQDDGLRFGNESISPQKQYYIEVEQLSLTGEAFAFNKLLSSQLEIDGDIFDPPPAQLTGNISNIDNPDEVVVGFFWAYSVQKAGTFVNQNDLEHVQRNPRPCGDCRQRRFARTEVPEVFR